MTELTILVPTRGRPLQARVFAGDFYNTIQGTSKVVFIIDSDDPSKDLYIADLNGDFEYIIAPETKRGMVGALNWAFHKVMFFDEPFAVGFMGDDHRPRTPGWDVAYLNELERLGTGMVYGDDLLQGAVMPTQIAMTSDIPTTLGYMAYPGFDHLCVDVAWKALGEALGNRISYLPDVVVEHMHPLAGKAKMDKSYRVVNAPAIAQHDNAAFLKYRDEVLPSEVELLKAKLGL